MYPVGFYRKNNVKLPYSSAGSSGSGRKSARTAPVTQSAKSKASRSKASSKITDFMKAKSGGGGNEEQPDEEEEEGDGSESNVKGAAPSTSKDKEGEEDIMSESEASETTTTRRGGRSLESAKQRQTGQSNEGKGSAAGKPNSRFVHRNGGSFGL